MPWQLQWQRIKGKQRCRAHAVCMFVCALGREAGIWKEELAWTFWVVAEVLGCVGHRGNAADVGWEAVLGVRRTHLEAIGVLERDAMCPGIPGSKQINSWAICCDLPCSLSWAELIYSTKHQLVNQTIISTPLYCFSSLFLLSFPIKSWESVARWTEPSVYLSAMEWSLGAWMCDQHLQPFSAPCVATPIYTLLAALYPLYEEFKAS